jgi:hypothetical protein
VCVCGRGVLHACGFGAVCASVCVWNVLISVCVMRLVCRPGVSMKILNVFVLHHPRLLPPAAGCVQVALTTLSTPASAQLGACLLDEADGAGPVHDEGQRRGDSCSQSASVR